MVSYSKTTVDEGGLVLYIWIYIVFSINIIVFIYAVIMRIRAIMICFKGKRNKRCYDHVKDEFECMICPYRCYSEEYKRMIRQKIDELDC